LGQTDLTELARAEAEIQELAVSEPTRRYLLAQLYQQHEMRAAAVAQLEALAEADRVVASPIFQQWGDLQFEMGLYLQAEKHYQRALAVAGEAEPAAQAAAHLGLARVASAFGEIEQALEHLVTAEALYHQAGEMEQAEMVAKTRAKLE
jgi:tetratricopeptide (TPR) repeat protein